MVAERSVGARCFRLQPLQGNPPRRQLVEASADQVGMPSDQRFEASQLVPAGEWAAMPLVQPGNLFGSEILQRKADADVERRLTEIRDEQVCFRRIGQRQS